MNRFPRYPKKAHRTGQARIVLYGKHTYLGVFGSEASWSEYQRLLSEWRAGRLNPAGGADDPPPAVLASTPVDLVAELVARYLFWREEEHPGKVENKNIALALKPLVRLLGLEPVAGLTRKGLREALKQTAREGAWSRGYANRCFARWKAVFAWAEGDGELVKAGSFAGLLTVKGLGEGEAHETEPTTPADEADVLTVLPKLNPIARALVETLLWTGARPSELFRLTPGDLDRSGEVELARGYRVRLKAGVWVLDLRRHKTRRFGRRRFVLFGPRAQAALGHLLEGRPADSPVFSPREASRKQPGTRGYPGERYTRRALNHALGRACRRAGVRPFSPYDLRRATAVRLEREFGPAYAQLALGHSDLKTTALYADLGRVAAALEAAG